MFCFVMNSQPSSCLGCFSGSELAQSGPIWWMGRWVNWAPPFPTPLSSKEKHAALCSPLSKIQLLRNKVSKSSQVPARYAQIPLGFLRELCVLCGYEENAGFLVAAQMISLKGRSSHVHTNTLGMMYAHTHKPQPCSFMNGLVVKDWLRQHID